MRTAGLLLAAGTSRRLGVDKRTLRGADGSTLLGAAARRLIAVADPAIVVVSGDFDRWSRELAGLDLTLVDQPHPEAGLGSSLALGARALRAALRDSVVGHLLLTLVDQPAVDLPLLENLLEAARTAEGWAACDYGGGAWGVPAVVPLDELAVLSTLAGERGARSRLALAAGRGALRLVPAPAAARDVDSRADLERERLQPGTESRDS